jgi:hypothetical protein
MSVHQKNKYDFELTRNTAILLEEPDRTVPEVAESLGKKTTYFIGSGSNYREMAKLSFNVMGKCPLLQIKNAFEILKREIL